MQEWRDEWYPNAGRTYGTPGGMMGGSMLGTASTDATDAAFLMIPHHQQAIVLSEVALDEAGHPGLKRLAQEIIDEQSAEIKLTQGYLEEIEVANSF